MERLTVTIKTLSPVVLTAMNNAAVMTESKEFISGSILRGILAARYIKVQKLGKDAQQDAAFRKLFFGSLRFVDAYPVKDGTRAFILPFSLQKAKVAEKNADGTEELLDILLHEPKPGFKAIKGFAVAEGNRIVTASVKKQIKLHMSRFGEEERLSGRSLDGGIFNYEAVEAGQEFAGYVIGEKNDLELLLKNIDVPKGGMDCRIGRSKFTEYGHCRMSFGKTETLPVERKAGNIVYLRLETPWLPEHQTGGLQMVQSAKEVVEAFAGNLNQALGCTDIKVGTVIAKAENTENFVGIWGMRRPVETALSAGSIFALEKPSGWDTDSNAILCQFLYRGVGRRTEEGFGQLRIWSVDKPVLWETGKTCSARKHVESAKAKEIAKSILRQRIINRVRLQAKEDLQYVNGKLAEATHSFARLESMLGERKDLDKAKERFQKKLLEELREGSVLDKRLQNLTFRGRELKEILLGEAPLPYAGLNFKEEISPELAEDIGYILPDSKDGALFYEYWLWFFRHGRKEAVRRKGKN